VRAGSGVVGHAALWLALGAGLLAACGERSPQPPAAAAPAASPASQVQDSPVDTAQAQTLEAPMLAQKVRDAGLPPLQQRLPRLPKVVDLQAEGKTAGRYGGTLRLLMGDARDIGQIPVYAYARLIGYDTRLALVPDLALSIDEADGRIFTIRLRPGHRWSDGHPFTAEDFRYYWKDMVQDPKLGREGVPQEMLADGELPAFEVLDAQTVRYTWKARNPMFLPALAGPAPLMIYRPAHYLKQFHARYADAARLDAAVKAEKVHDWSALHTKRQRYRRPENPDLPTLDPWRNTSPPPTQRFVFERNPYYHRVDSLGRQLPYIDRIVMEIAADEVIPAKTGAGESDLQARYIRFDNYTFLKRAEAENGTRTLLWHSARGSQVALFPNLNASDPGWRSVLRDVRVRRALSLAIDRNEINQAVCFGLAEPSADTVLPQSPLFREAYRRAWSAHDPKQANRLLDAAGLQRRDVDGIRLLPDGRRAELTIETAGESTEEADVLQLIVDHWQQVGLKAHVHTSQRTLFRRRAASGETLVSAFFGLNNALASPSMSPNELAPTSGAQLQWPMWGQHFESNAKAGRPIDLPEAARQLALYREWLAADGDARRADVWAQMLEHYTDQVFSIGTVNGTRQPVVVSRRLRNVPEDGLYAWEPTAHFGVYRPDTFYFADAR
jgi:peptide/nickel transport system substrate-binding protein